MNIDNISINITESEYDADKLVCAWCYGHVDKKHFAEVFCEMFLVNGLVKIGENDVHHDYVQTQEHLDGKHLFFDEKKDGKDFLDEYDSPSPVTVIYGGAVNSEYKRLKRRAFFINGYHEALGKNDNIAITVEAYRMYKYDEDFVDLVIYNKETYAHIVLFESTISVFDKNGNELMNTSFEKDDFKYLIGLAVKNIK